MLIGWKFCVIVRRRAAASPSWPLRGRPPVSLMASVSAYASSASASRPAPSPALLAVSSLPGRRFRTMLRVLGGGRHFEEAAELLAVRARAGQEEEEGEGTKGAKKKKKQQQQPPDLVTDDLNS